MTAGPGSQTGPAVMPAHPAHTPRTKGVHPVKVTINVDGQEFDFDTVTRASNRDAMALEDAVGCTFETFMKRFGKRFKEIGQNIETARQAAIAAAPAGTDPATLDVNLEDVDTSLSARDTTALVFLARRRAGERDLKFDDVDFELASFRFGTDGEPDVPVTAPDAALAGVDPTNGDAETSPSESGNDSSPNV